MKCHTKSFIGIYLLMLVVIFVLPFYSFENYSILKNSTSQLGAQNAPNGWVMNLIFAGLGLCSIWAGWNFYKRFAFHRVLLIFFGGSLVACSFFNHAPIAEGVPFSAREDYLHSVFASLTGISFTILAFLTGLILRDVLSRVFAFFIGSLASVLSILIFNLLDLMGVFQRLMFITSFGWMIYLFSGKLILKRY